MRARASLPSVLVALLAAVPVHAGEDLWIHPEPPLAAPGATVTLSLREGPAFGERARTKTLGAAERFQRLWRSGREHLARSDAGAPARFTAAEAGVQVIAYGPAGGRSSEREHYCKALVVIGDPAPGGQLHLSEVGQRLEIVPQTDPVTLLDGGPRLEVQVLFEREPLAFGTIEAVPAGDPGAGRVQARTDEIGLAGLRLDGPGLWLVRVEHENAVSSLVLWRGGAP